MVQTKSIIFIGLCMFSSFSCKNDGQHNKSLNQKNMEKAYNPVVYFEIPVKDMDRAIKFYTAVFSFEFKKEIIDHNEMALFPLSDESKGISGALAKGEIYKPTQNGVVIYFRTTDIDKTLELVVTSGGEILYPKTSNGDLGFVAEFKDSEGNRIALHQGL
jgi:predicted enzyme related to lactoylglutathione lyase